MIVNSDKIHHHYILHEFLSKDEGKKVLSAIE